MNPQAVFKDYEVLNAMLSACEQSLRDSGVNDCRPLAIAAVDGIASTFAGMQVYIPNRDKIKRQLRNELLLADAKRMSKTLLARKYGISYKQACEILRNAKQNAA